MDESVKKLAWTTTYYPNEFDPKSDKSQSFHENYSKISDNEAEYCHDIIESVYNLVTDFHIKGVKFCDMHFIKYVGKFKLLIWTDVSTLTFHFKFVEISPTDPLST